MPSSQETTPKTPQENLERIANLLEKIENHLSPPPVWQRWGSYVFHHLPMILSLLALAFFTWNIWGNVRDIIEYFVSLLGKVDFLKDAMAGMDKKVLQGMKDLKFW